MFMPNVLKVYLENGQTKSFRFDSSTSIKVCLFIGSQNAMLPQRLFFSQLQEWIEKETLQMTHFNLDQVDDILDFM